ncbi:MAG: hypothetical protein QM652_03105 [Legionella sp.]|uniref:hypothetical protein n=1 Tax=Legionella sp. TaxID=459 RepID=UPI0039E52163
MQEAFVESYGLKKYKPTIMQPKHFNFETDYFPIYYSLQHPATRVFSPRSRLAASTINEMRELEHIMNIFIEELSKDGTLSSDTVVGQIAKFVKFNYFHNAIDTHNILRNSLELLNNDRRFNNTLFPHTSEAVFAADASFLRGCVSIDSAEIPTQQKTHCPDEHAAMPE